MKSLTAMLVPAFDHIENGFSIKGGMQWMDDYWMVSAILSVVYLVLIYVGRQVMKNRAPYSLRKPLILWNVGLAMFSFLGAHAIVPNLFIYIYTNGFLRSACSSELISDKYINISVWGWLFALSKVMEFGDTAFIVLRKSPLHFLHWYHHVSVCIFTWYALTTEPTALASWFAGMNFLVHTVMYTYYAARAMGFRPHPLIAKVITVLQLSQMFVGITLNLVSWLTTRSGGECNFRYDVFYVTAAIYGSYAILFANFFYHRYVKKPSCTPEPKPMAGTNGTNGATPTLANGRSNGVMRRS